MKFSKASLIIILLTTIGIVLHFFNLNWGAPFYFHPDERNIIYSVLQLSFPKQMDPHFFAYGTVPIYTIYFVFVFLSKIFNNTSQFVIAIFIGRFFSALFATILIPFMYFLGVKLKDKTTGIISAFFTTTSIGFMQFAHYASFEMWLTIFTLILFYICINLLKNRNLNLIFLTGIILGTLVGIKITSIVLLPLPFTAIAINYFSLKRVNIKMVCNFLRDLLLIVLLGFIAFCITNPFVILDFPSFISSINYESSVATGALPVFYTGEFYNTIPVIFQLVKVLPFLITWPVEILFILLIPLFLNLSFKRKNYSYFLLILFFAITFFSQSVLFVKWTRYIVPSIPFIYLILSISLAVIFEKIKSQKLVNLLSAFGIFFVSIFSISFFITVYLHTDTRVLASSWASTNIKPNSRILSEVYDLGIIPFNQYFPKITLFNFYDLDSPSGEVNKIFLDNLLSQNDYIILPSQRIYRNRILNNSKFPNGNIFYSKLFSGKLGFTKIYQTPCDIFCKITYLNNPVFSYEETASVFDRPTVYIFKKRLSDL